MNTTEQLRKDTGKYLRRVKTYSIKMGISHTEVYNRIATGEIECIEIDGVKFIVDLGKSKSNQQ